MFKMPASAIRRSPHEEISYTILNVKPYYLIKAGERIWLCDGRSGFPFAFDTLALAEFCVQDRGLTNCVIEKWELEELAHACRDKSIPFNNFAIIDKLSQI